MPPCFVVFPCPEPCLLSSARAFPFCCFPVSALTAPCTLPSPKTEADFCLRLRCLLRCAAPSAACPPFVCCRSSVPAADYSGLTDGRRGPPVLCGLSKRRGGGGILNSCPPAFRRCRISPESPILSLCSLREPFCARPVYPVCYLSFFLMAKPCRYERFRHGFFIFWDYHTMA